jgi:ketosteroid isomerase-like protein
LSETPLEIVKRMYEAFSRGDVEGAVATVSADVVWRSPESMPWSTGEQVGPEAIVRYFTVMAEHLEDTCVEDVEYLEAGDWVVAFGWIPGRAKATGRPFRARFAHLSQVRDGRIVRHEGYPDAAAILAAMRDGG